MLTSYSYASVPSDRSDTGAIDRILSSAFQRNTEMGVTGALYSDGETFFQVIEGQEPVLARLMSLILKDPRHAAIAILDQTDLDRRMFAGFAIKHVDGTRRKDLQDRYTYRALTNAGEAYVSDRVCELAQL